MADAPLTTAEIEAAVTRGLGRRFAEWLAEGIALAGAMHPELIRTALSQVFNLGSVERYVEKSFAVTQDMATRAQLMREDIQGLSEGINKDLDWIERRQDTQTRRQNRSDGKQNWIERRLFQAEKRIEELLRRLEQAERRLPSANGRPPVRKP